MFLRSANQLATLSRGHLRLASRSIITVAEVKYTAHATATGGGRNGKTSSKGPPPLDIKMSSPKELGGSGDGHNPEQLFALGYSACFLGALRLVAGQQKKADLVKDAKVHVAVNIGTPKDLPGFGLSVKIEVENVKDISLVQAAHEFCPYSRSLKHGIDVQIGLKD